MLFFCSFFTLCDTKEESMKKSFYSFLFMFILFSFCYNLPISLPIGGNSNIVFTVDSSLSYSISVNNTIWFYSSPLSVHANHKWYILGNDYENQLTITYIKQEEFQSELFGNYSRISYGLQMNEDSSFIIGFNVYKETSMIEFTQEFPNGLEKTSLHDPFQVICGFPSFSLNPYYSNLPNLSSLTWQSLWDNGTMGYGLNHVYGGLEGGVPVILWNQTLEYPDIVAVLSPFKNYMVGYQVRKYRNPDELSFACGFSGMIEYVPKNFNHSSIIYFGNNGVSSTVYEWGSTHLKNNNKIRINEMEIRDLATTSLGYWTDNGAYYYYNTLSDIPESNYEETLISVSDYHKKLNIPVAYYQFDSWWYYKSEPGDGNCTLFDCGGMYNNNKKK